MFVTRANALFAASFMAGRFLIIALTASKSAFCDQVLGCKSISWKQQEKALKVCESLHQSNLLNVW